MNLYPEDPDFILKRIQEQRRYILSIMKSNKPKDRKKLLLESAEAVLNKLLIEHERLCVEANIFEPPFGSGAHSFTESYDGPFI